jgi:hypothetical protein
MKQMHKQDMVGGEYSGRICVGNPKYVQSIRRMGWLVMNEY